MLCLLLVWSHGPKRGLLALRSFAAEGILPLALRFTAWTGHAKASWLLPVETTASASFAPRTAARTLVRVLRLLAQNGYNKLMDRSSCSATRWWSVLYKVRQAFPMGCARACSSAAQQHQPTLAFNKNISDCRRSHDWQRAVCLLQGAASTGQRDLVSYNCTMTVCKAAGEWKLASLLLRGVEEDSLESNIITQTAAMRACGPGQWMVAWFLLFKARILQMQSNEISYGSLLHSDKRRAWKRSMLLLNGLEQLSIQLNLVICNSAVSSVAEEAKWQLAVFLGEARSVKHMSPDTISCNACITAFEKVL